MSPKLRPRNIEPKTSRIQWEKADPALRQQVVTFLHHSSGILPLRIARIIILLPGCVPFLLAALCLYIANTSREPIPPWIVGIYLTCCAAGFLGLLYKYLRHVPYMYPEKQPDVWFFRAKCHARHITSRHGSDHYGDYYFADFHKAGIPIHVETTHQNYQDNPAGKTFVFFKFNDRTGNPWSAFLEADDPAANKS